MKRILCMFLTTLSLFAFSGCSSTNAVKIGTGDENGTYYAYGSQLTQILNKSGDFKFNVAKTAGSAANLRLLSEDYIGLAFAQSDVMNDAYNGTGYFDKPYKGYSAIAALYTEAIQVVTSENSDIQSIKDLYGKRVSLGEKESGVLQNAKQIIAAYGLNETSMNAKYLSYTDAANELKNGNIDAFFCTAGTPTHAIKNIAETIKIKLIPITGTEAERLSEQYGSYEKYTVKAGTYNGQNEDIETLGVKMILAVSDKMSVENVNLITKTLFEYRDELDFITNSHFDINFAVENVPIQFHTGAVKYYSEQGIEIANDY